MLLWTGLQSFRSVKETVCWILTLEFAVANGPRRADDRNGSRGSASARGGRLASLNWVPREQKHLTSEEIEIKLHAIDLNFKVSTSPPPPVNSK